MTMENLDALLTTLKKGQLWLDSMLDMFTARHGLRDPKKIGKETRKRKDFEHNAKHYLKHVPDISELIKPGNNDTKLTLKSKLSDILIFGKVINGRFKIDFEKTISNFKQQIQDIIKKIEILKEELSPTKLKELELRSGTTIQNTKSPGNDSELLKVEENEAVSSVVCEVKEN